MSSRSKRFYGNESNNMMIPLSDTLVKKSVARDFNHSRVVNFSSQQVIKDDIVWETASRTLLQHHSFKNSALFFFY